MDDHALNLFPGPGAVNDFIGHIDDWLEYLSELALTADDRTLPKLRRQITYLLRFRAGANCNINHNRLLQYYYSHPAKVNGDDLSLPGEQCNAENLRAGAENSDKVQAFLEEFHTREGGSTMVITPQAPIQSSYQAGDPAFTLIGNALAAEDFFCIQGPPGTGKTTAIVEIILQTVKAKPCARILISSETHVAVDNALDRLAQQCAPELLNSILRYPRYSITEFESPETRQTDAMNRADTLWHNAYRAAPQLTMDLWETLKQGTMDDNGRMSLPRWQARNLAEMHQLIGVTCNQIDHLFDDETEMFDLVIVDECSKATMPEWLMAMSVARKCILVGDHKQLPPTFCAEEAEVLTQMDEHKEQLIRNGVLERLFENLPTKMKGMLNRQFRMLPHIGQFISHHFYKGELQHYRTTTDHEFHDFGWYTYKSRGLSVPAQQGKERKILINEAEIHIIMSRLTDIFETLKRSGSRKKISVALITPYRAQCKALRETLSALAFSEFLAVEVDTVDAFQGRQADIVFFSFVRNTGPATFYADDRRINVAISRARDAVYLVGDIEYIRSKRLPVLDALGSLPVLGTHM